MLITTIADEIAENLEEQINILKEMKIEYIEMRKINNRYLWEYSIEELKKMENLLKRNGIKVIMIDTPIGKKNNSFNYEQNMQLLDKYIEISNIFKAK